MAELTLVVATHHFVVRSIQAGAYPHVISFVQRFIQKGTVRKTVPGRRPLILHGQPVKMFAAATKDRKEFRFHIHCLKQFLDHMNLHFVRVQQIDRVDRPIPEPRKVELMVREGWVTREDQQPVVNYGLQEQPRSKLIGIQTGKGKGYTSMRIMADRGVLPVIVIKPMYMEKWIRELCEIYEIEKKDIMVVQGSKELQALLLMTEAGQDDWKIVILSNKTYQNWLSLYEAVGPEYFLELGYPCLPEQLYEQLRAGFRLIDEVHQDFHLNFKQDLYTHVAQSLSLSATLLGDDEFVNRMYELAYPRVDRGPEGVYDRYAVAEAVIYSFADPSRLRWVDPSSKFYSHVVFEQSLLQKRNEALLDNYFRMIYRIVRVNWLTEDYAAGERCLVFVSTIEMATRLTDYLKQMFVGKDVRRYVGEDEFANLMEADLSVSTLLSAGTAVDIPDLTYCLMTTALSSSQGNVQGFGRLRKLKSGKTPRFSYLVCSEIQKHIHYHEKKRKVLEARALHYKVSYISQPL